MRVVVIDIYDYMSQARLEVFKNVFARYLPAITAALLDKPVISIFYVTIRIQVRKDGREALATTTFTGIDLDDHLLGHCFTHTAPVRTGCSCARRSTG